MNIEKQLKTFQKEFNPKLLKFLDKKEKDARKLAPGYQTAIKEIKRLINAGGKRLRPLMIYTACKSLKNKANKDVWSSCIAVELIHSFCLIHDDIMDNAKLRRGKPTAFKKLGVNKAILIGDISLILANELIPNQAKQYFDLLKWEVSAGQWLDISSTSEVKSKDTSEVLKLMELKTARYTFSRPLQIGALLAGANKKTLNAFYNYGVKLGLAFQIQDDILGLFGNEKTTGKPVGADIRENKKTLFISELIKTIEQLNNETMKKKFVKIFSDQQATENEIQWIVNLMLKYNILKKVKQKAKNFVEHANQEIKQLKINKKQKEFFLEIGNYIISRKK